MGTSRHFAATRCHPGMAPRCCTFSLKRSLCCSNRRRFDSSSQSILWASNVFTPASLKRTIRPLCRCTIRRASATCSSTRRRSSSTLIMGAQSSGGLLFRQGFPPQVSYLIKHALVDATNAVHHGPFSQLSPADATYCHWRAFSSDDIRLFG